MSEEDAWDADDFDPEAGFSKGPEAEGEDETWEGEDEGLVLEGEKQSDVKSKPKKSKQERIEERKAKRREEELKNKPDTGREEEEAGRPPLTAEEVLEEKRRVEEAQRAADLESARELFGGGCDAATTSEPASVSGQLERMNPKTPEEFEEFRSALAMKITEFEASTNYTSFLEELFRSLTTSLDTEDLRRLSTTLGAMATEKQKLKQPHTRKKKGKALGNVGKASKKVDVDTYDNDLGADFDDFM